ncbi:PLP-dependent aminotransferase family protein [Paludibaculum fermentans]|uniref:MocR-like pyridoxine biosynthesis transcription factor PdxR n=1 Tax=Paludibaculum fermentans TaxID=1473598 RepID=UPI003EB8C5BE
MGRKSSTFLSPLFTLDPASADPLYHQLYGAIRDAILDGRIAKGTQLPSSRMLSTELSVSRNTVVNAYEQLLAEGYLEGEAGSGTYVTLRLPDESLRAVRSPSGVPAAIPDPPRLSRQGQALQRYATTHTLSRNEPRPFRPGVPAVDEFPFRLWERMVAQQWRKHPWPMLTYGPAEGYQPLRVAIADYLRMARAVRCDWRQVILVSGSQQAIDLTARVLLDPGDGVWMEEPGYRGARDSLLAAGLDLAPVPVDDEGLSVRAGRAMAPEARLAYVTPSHQFPSGVTMSVARRMELLRWAAETGSWILEDDYDSEYRYVSRPLSALQGLDESGRVIYAGTFSKVLFPSLRLGYLVAPPALVDVFTAARAIADRHSPMVDQAVLAEFMKEGHFGRHIRRMRTLYQERRDTLVEVLTRELGGLLELSPAAAGMHLVGWLPPGIDDRAASRCALEAGVEAQAISAYCLAEPARRGLMLGYAGYSSAALKRAAGQLAQALAGLSAAAPPVTPEPL